jgi:hypothetical protein
VLTAQHGAATQNRQNSQKRGAAEKQGSAGLSSVQAMAGNCWHSVARGAALGGVVSRWIPCLSQLRPSWSLQCSLVLVSV